MQFYPDKSVLLFHFYLDKSVLAMRFYPDKSVFAPVACFPKNSSNLLLCSSCDP